MKRTEHALLTKYDPTVQLSRSLPFKKSNLWMRSICSLNVSKTIFHTTETMSTSGQYECTNLPAERSVFYTTQPRHNQEELDNLLLYELKC